MSQAYRFTLNESDSTDIVKHLELVGHEFTQNIQLTTTIHAYAKKLENFAYRIEIWNDELLVGLLAYYLATTEIYISNFSVIEKNRNIGMGSLLMKKFFELELKAAHQSVCLEVEKTNTRAILFYTKNGFEITRDKGTYLRMERYAQL